MLIQMQTSALPNTESFTLNFFLALCCCNYFNMNWGQKDRISITSLYLIKSYSTPNSEHCNNLEETFPGGSSSIFSSVLQHHVCSSVRAVNTSEMSLNTSLHTSWEEKQYMILLCILRAQHSPWNLGEVTPYWVGFLRLNWSQRHLWTPLFYEKSSMINI